MEKERLDRFLAETGRYESRSKALKEIAAGNISVNGRIIRRPSYPVSPSDKIDVEGCYLRYVGAAGLKLATFLDDSAIDVRGLSACDVGSSTGGFTQVLFERGAARVTAVDVGSGQMHVSLIKKAGLELRENTDFRDFFRSDERCFDIITADLSFISLRKFVPCVSGRADTVIMLFKPQFETVRGMKNKKGVVTNLATHEEILISFRDYLLKEGFLPFIIRRSGLLGGEGNREYFVACSSATGTAPVNVGDIEREVYKSEDFINHQPV